MVKLMYVITPKPGMNRDEFQRYWLETHAPIVKEIPHLERYVIKARHVRGAVRMASPMTSRSSTIGLG